MGNLSVNNMIDKITFYMDNRKYTRTIKTNKRGTKCIEFKKELIPVSKLKKTPPKK